MQKNKDKERFKVALEKHLILDRALEAIGIKPDSSSRMWGNRLAKQWNLRDKMLS